MFLDRKLVLVMAKAASYLLLQFTFRSLEHASTFQVTSNSTKLGHFYV